MENRFRVLMGLDISTKTIGVTVAAMDEEMNLKILEVDYINLNCHLRRKDPKLIHEKARIFERKLSEKYSKYHVTDVIIEKAIFCDRNVGTSMTLLRFNGMCADIIYREYGITPEYISTYNARKYGLPVLLTLRKYNREGMQYPRKAVIKAMNRNHFVLFGEYPYDCSKKYIIWNYVKEKFTGIKWMYDQQGKLRGENFDAADSLLCVVGYVNMLKYGSDARMTLTERKEDTERGLIHYTVSFCGEEHRHSMAVGD